MRTNIQTSRSSILSEPSLTPHHTNKSQTKKSGVIKLLIAVPMPDEAIITALNELASQAPFGRPHKARHHDTL